MAITSSDPESIFITALAFEEAAIVVANTMVPDAPATPKTSKSVVPHVVLDAFCLELFFKCLSVLDSGKYKGTHDLEKLFLALKPDRQKRIEEFAEHFNQKFQPSPFTSKTVVEILHEAANSFEDWRYVFENKPSLSYACAHIVDAARYTILEIRNDWIPIADKHLR